MSNTTRFTSLILGTAALVALATACGSQADGSGNVPGVTEEGLGAQDYSCVNSRIVQSSDLSRALARTCGCSHTPVHLANTPAQNDIVDCSSATLECVNGVLDTNGYRNPPWSATTTAFPPCMSLAVAFDPCPACIQNPTFVGSDGGATADDDEDDDDQGDDGHRHHHHGY